MTEPETVDVEPPDEAHLRAEIGDDSATSGSWFELPSSLRSSLP